MSDLICIKCNSKNVFVARDMKATRRCGDCHHTWLPADDGKIIASEAALRERVAVLEGALRQAQHTLLGVSLGKQEVDLSPAFEAIDAALTTLKGTPDAG